jgi:hypothetical protein
MPPEARFPRQRPQDEVLSTIPGASRSSFFARLSRFTIFNRNDHGDADSLDTIVPDDSISFRLTSASRTPSTSTNNDDNPIAAPFLSTIIPSGSISVAHLENSAGLVLSTPTDDDDGSDAESVHTIRPRNVATSTVSQSTGTYSSSTVTGTSFTSASGTTEVSIQASAYSLVVPGIYQVLVTCGFILIHSSARAPSLKFTYRARTGGMEEEVAALVIDNGCVVHLC